MGSCFSTPAIELDAADQSKASTSQRGRTVRGRIALVPLLWLLMPGCATSLPEFKGSLVSGGEFITLSTRAGVTVRFLLLIPDNAASARAVVLYFPGGGGTLVGSDGRLRYARVIRRLAEQPFITAVVDRPSDRPMGMAGTDRFRASKEHAIDIEQIIDLLRRRWDKPVFLVGHSGGSTSVAYLGSVFDQSRVSGIVLMAGISSSDRGGVSLANLPIHEIVHPTLIVHHVEDLCADFDGIRQRTSSFTKSSRVDFIQVLGGDRSRTLQCSPSNRRDRADYAHFFSGWERQVFQAIGDWIAGESIPDRIGP